MRFGDFEIRPTAYLDGHKEPHHFQVVKWYKTKEPIEVTDWHTGEKKMKDTFTYAVAEIYWDEKEPGWEFESYGTRFLEDYQDGLAEFILKWLEQYDLVREKEAGADDEP